jgi:predicted nucleic acid-binding protein
MTTHGPVVVVDTSAVLAVLLREPSRDTLVALTESRSLIAAPSLPWEVGNALIAGLRRRRLTAKAVQFAWASYVQIAVRLLHVDARTALGLASSLGLYAYDAYVLEAARAARAPLLTLDAALGRAARSIGLTVIELPE